MNKGERYFSEGQSIEINNRLSPYFNNPISKEDFYSFIYWIERLMSINETRYECQFENHKERINWGRKLYDGKMRWKLDRIIDILEETGIIFCSSYRFGEKDPHTRTYQFSIEFKDKIKSSNLILNQVNESILSKIDTNKIEYTNPQYKLLTSDRFSINIDSSFNSIEKLDSYNEAIYKRTILDLYQKNIYLSTGIKSGRITSSFTNVKREVREFCTIDGIKLESLDLQSSQAYLLCNKIIDNNKETKKFYDIIVNGNLYNYLDDKLNIGINETKKAFYHYLYKGNLGQHTIVQDIIIDKFPHVNKLVMKLNRELSKEGNKLVNILQKEEASIFIPVATKYALEGCLSVHDSLYFKPELKERILEDLNYQFKIRNYKNYTLR